MPMKKYAQSQGLKNLTKKKPRVAKISTTNSKKKTTKYKVPKTPKTSGYKWGG